jgi:hypothetical protein
VDVITALPTVGRLDRRDCRRWPHAGVVQQVANVGDALARGAPQWVSSGLRSRLGRSPSGASTGHVAGE